MKDDQLLMKDGQLLMKDDQLLLFVICRPTQVDQQLTKDGQLVIEVDQHLMKDGQPLMKVYHLPSIVSLLKLSLFLITINLFILEAKIKV